MFTTTIHNNNQRVDAFTFSFVNSATSSQTLTTSVGIGNTIYDNGVLIHATPSTARNRFEYYYGSTIYNVRNTGSAAQLILGSSSGTLIIKTHKRCLTSAFDISTTSIQTGLVEMDLSGFTGLSATGSNRGITSNNNILTDIIFPYSDTIFISTVSGNLINLSNSPNLTSIDMSGFHGIGGYIQGFGCPLLSTIILPTSILPDVYPIQRFYFYNTSPTGVLGPLDLSVLTNLGGDVRFQNNPLMGSIIFPNTSHRVSNINLSNCGVGYINLTPLSYSYATGSSITISANTNNISKINMNHLLVDLDNLGWTGGTLTANSGNNGYDNSGGYNGTTARTNLISKGWTITL